MSADDHIKHNNATHCWICTGPFKNYIRPEWTDVPADSAKVVDHDHNKKTGSNYRGAAHSWCNLQCNNGWENGKPT